MGTEAIKLKTDTAVDPLAGLTDAQRAQIGQRMRIVEGWRRIRTDFASQGLSISRATTTYLNANPELSETTLYRWETALRDEGPIGLLNKQTARPPAEAVGCSDAAWQCFLGLFLDPRKPSVAACHMMTALMAKRHGWAWPALRTIQERVRRMPPAEIDYHRLGPREWARLHEPKIHRDFSAYRSGQTWCADFHELDVFCRRSEEDATICRPLLSAFRDIRSRVVVGWHISLRECQDTVLLALRSGIERYGPPLELILDNGKPYRSYGVSGGRGPAVAVRLVEDEDYVRSVLGALEIVPHFATPYGPNSKPIEGWFGQLCSQFSRTFPTYCGGQKDDLFRSAAKLAREHPELCPTVAELAAKFSRYLDAYHITPNHGEDLRGMTPAEAWVKLDPIPRRVLPDGALDILLMRVTKPVTVRCCEVRHNHCRYYDERLLRLNRSKVRLRVHPEDASFVLVCDLDGKPLFRAVNPKMAAFGVTQAHVAEGMKAKARARRVAKAAREGATRPICTDVTDLAIDARLAAGDSAFLDKLQKATGTDGRNIQPLRSEFADSVERLKKSELAARGMNPDGTRRRTLSEMVEAFADDEDRPEPPRRTLSEMLEGVKPSVRYEDFGEFSEDDQVAGPGRASGLAG